MKDNKRKTTSLRALNKVAYFKLWHMIKMTNGNYPSDSNVRRVIFENSIKQESDFCS